MVVGERIMAISSVQVVIGGARWLLLRESKVFFKLALFMKISVFLLSYALLVGAAS
jgi:hypothetical protein